MSATRYGPGNPGDAPNSAVAPENDKYASSAPLSTSGSMPSTPATPWTKSAAFAASRVALVATIRTASAERPPMILAYPRSAPSVRCSASGASRPVESTPWPSRTICIRRSTSVSRPAPGSTSATSSRSELVPQSMAATRAGFAGGSRDARALRPPCPAASAASRPSGLAPGTASSCATRACRHFTRSGMPPALCVPDGSGSTPAAAAAAARRPT